MRARYPIFVMSINRDMDKYLRLFIYSGGIFICFLYYSILQERITKRVYYYGTSREGQEMFTCYLTLVFIQCVVSYVYANLLLRTVMKERSENRTKTLYYWTSALTNLLSTVCSSMALHWISYPAQIIGKSGKPIPVMMLGVLLGKKAYPYYRFVFVFILVFGVALFMWNGNEENFVVDKYSQEVGRREGDNHIGELLICLSLVMDGITAAIQERMRTEYMTKSLHMMSSLNKWSVVFLGVALSCTGEIITFLEFVNRHPDVLWDTISFSMVNTQGQLFIFLMIEHFGPLPCSLVTTLRKFFTVFASVFIFGNRLFFRQWIATIIIFTGLLLDIVWKDFYTHIIVDRCCGIMQARRTRSREIGYRHQWV